MALISLANIVAEAQENSDVPSGFTGVGLGGGGGAHPHSPGKRGCRGFYFS